MEYPKPVRLMGLLMRLGRGKISPCSLRKIERRPEITPFGLSFDTYTHEKKNGPIWILAHGMSVNGKNDHRLVHFAQSLACSGVTCIAPMLNGLSSCRWEPSDLDNLDQLVQIISGRYGREVGLIGFSFGGSYCLLTAACGKHAEQVRQIISFGAYYNWEDIFAEYKKNSNPDSLTDEEWDQWLYMRLVIIKGYRETALSPEAGREIDSALERYCKNEVSTAEKKRLYREYIQYIDLNEALNAAIKPDILNALSPAGKLANLTCPVTLIHDRHDPVVPSLHAERIYSELLKQPHPHRHRHRLTLTSILNHVSASPLLDIPDFFRFFKAMSDVL